MAATSEARKVTEAHEAHQYFLQQARQLPGIVRVEMHGDGTLSEPRFLVYVPEGDIETEKQIYRLKAEVYHRYPKARLDVWIEEEPVAAAPPQLDQG